MGKGYYDEQSENCLSRIKAACNSLYQHIKKSKNEKDVTDKRLRIFTTISGAYKDLQGEFAAAVSLSQSDNTLFLSNEGVKNYMASQAETLKKSIDKLESGLENVKKESNGQRAVRAENFLKDIENNKIYFDVFPSTQGLNFTHCCNYLYRGDPQAVYTSDIKIKGTPVIAAKLGKLISTILGKGEFENNTVKKYLETLAGACNGFSVTSTKNEKTSYNPTEGLTAYKEISQAFKDIYAFSSDEKNNESKASFLSNVDVKGYLKQQSEALEESYNNLDNVSRRKN